jgi:hypothetical protein
MPYNNLVLVGFTVRHTCGEELYREACLPLDVIASSSDQIIADRAWKTVKPEVFGWAEACSEAVPPSAILGSEYIPPAEEEVNNVYTQWPEANTPFSDEESADTTVI